MAETSCKFLALYHVLCTLKNPPLPPVKTVIRYMERSDCTMNLGKAVLKVWTLLLEWSLWALDPLNIFDENVNFMRIGGIQLARHVLGNVM